MKRIQKIISTLLIVMLIAVQLIPIINVKAEEAGTLTITTYGENEDGIRSDLVTNTAKLTVSDFTNSDEFTAYKIIDTFYNDKTNEISYEFTNDFRTFLNQNEDYGETFTITKYFELTGDNPDGTASSSVITASTLNVLVSKYTNYIRNNDKITGIDMITTDTTATTEVEAGAYLILPKKVSTVNSNGDIVFGFKRNLYGVMVGNVIFTVNETTSSWKLNDVSVNAKKDDSGIMTSLGGFNLSEYFGVMDGTIKMEEIDPSFYQNISSSVGKKTIYYLQIRQIIFPTNAINKTYKLEINIPEGITYDVENIYNMIGHPETKISENQIIDKNSGNILGIITPSNKKIIIEFNLDNLVTTPTDVCLAFDIELNANATVGDSGNKITATLTTTDDPYVENSTTDITITNTITTYGLELTSYGEENTDGTRPLLKGAKYEVYSKYTDSVLNNKIGEFTVGDDGKTSFAGVPSGTIYLKQVKAPTGYQLIKEPIAVKIATEDATAGIQEGYYQVITYNDAMWYLPSTGGVGTVIYTLIGLVVIGISSVFVIKYKKSVKNSSLV